MMRFQTFLLALLVVGSLAACGGSGRPAPATPRPQATQPAQDESVQGLYESGRYREVVSRAGAATAGTAGAEATWLAAHSHVRLGQNAEAAARFSQLPALSPDPAWTVVSQLALAGLENDAAAADGARAAAAAHPAHAVVQYELGLAHARRGDFAGAAEAFERSIAADVRFAYAYYHAGLAYDRVNRPDLTIARFDSFLRLAPDAPERPEVESILRTLRRR